MTREINIGGGHVVIVDADDFDWVSRYTWHFKASSLTGYARTTPRGGGPHHYLHRLIMRSRPHEFVDHVNRDGLDNRKSNLRFCDHSSNMCNRFSTNRTGFRGVFLNRKLFYAAAKYKGIKRSCPGRTTAVEAARDYDNLAREMHGPFASLNFPGAQ